MHTATPHGCRHASEGHPFDSSDLCLLGNLQDIQKRLAIGILFITHDLRVASQICDRLVVMHQGRIVEQGSARDVLLQPQQDYTRSLLAAAPGQGWTFLA